MQEIILATTRKCHDIENATCFQRVHHDHDVNMMFWKWRAGNNNRKKAKSCCKIENAASIKFVHYLHFHHIFHIRHLCFECCLFHSFCKIYCNFLIHQCLVCCHSNRSFYFVCIRIFSIPAKRKTSSSYCCWLKQEKHPQKKMFSA